MLAAGEYNGEARRMRRASLGVMAAATALLTLVLFAQSGAAQKRGGILKMYDFDSPPTMSILEEGDRKFSEPDDGRVRQPCSVRSASEAEPARHNHTRSGY